VVDLILGYVLVASEKKRLVALRLVVVVRHG
jgi:hypothetical protein